VSKQTNVDLQKMTFWSFARDGGALASSFLLAIWQFHTIVASLLFWCRRSL
jgi:hypothetical protein